MKRTIIVCSLLAMAACVPIPPPPPAPAQPGPVAAPAGARVFTVYFNWNRSALGPDATPILQQAAAAYRAGGTVGVRVSGHADTSGSVRYNQGLSERRAKHVADALVGMGVPPQSVTFGGVGENDLAVPTPDGMREPRNRRVMIVE